MSDSPLKQYALPLLCDMAHASRNSREQLRAHGGLDVYLSLLQDELWSVTALDSIAVCLAHDNDSRKVEQALLKKEAVQKLVKFFENCLEQHFLHILEPFLKIITYVFFSIHLLIYVCLSVSGVCIHTHTEHWLWCYCFCHILNFLYCPYCKG